MLDCIELTSIGNQCGRTFTVGWHTYDGALSFCLRMVSLKLLIMYLFKFGIPSMQ